MRLKIFIPVIYLLSVFIIQYTDVSGQEKNIADSDSVLSRLAVLKNEYAVKSVIAGIWSGDREILSVALGESMTSVPADINMHIRIGGVSEIFFGTLLMIMSDKGMIDLNEKISTRLPDLLNADKVTPLMLIKNTAGYKDYVLNKEFIELVTKEPFRNITHEEIIAYSTKDGEMSFAPGTKQMYSHTEFTILEDFITRATGRTMPDLYDEFIFRPLGLENTGYCVNTELPFPVLHSFSSDRGVYEDATFWNPSWSGGSGPLYSTLPDLGKWAPAFGKGRLVTPETFKLQTAPPDVAVNPDLYFASGFAYSNGWYAQNPSFNGYSGAFGYHPSEDLTIIVYTTESENPNSGAKAFLIFKELVKMLTPDAEINF